MEHHYFVLENSTSTNKQSLSSGVFIASVTVNTPFNFADGDGPYKSIRAIKKYSPIFQNLKKTNSKRAQQVVLEKNIVRTKSFIEIPRGTTFKPEVVYSFIHASIGRIKNGNVTGVHFYNPERVRIIKTLKTNETNKTFLADFEFYDMDNKKWIHKKTPSSFFPADWNIATFLMEIKYAYDNANFNIDNGKIKSKTYSNIEVELYVKNGKLITIYPLVESL
jgi:hypothetical protein